MPDTETIDALIEEAEKAAEPGTLKLDQVVHRGDEDLPAPMRTMELESAGYTYIYDTVTNERSLTNNNMLPAQLQKMRANGSPYFTTRKPIDPPTSGSMLCPLHERSQMRAYYNTLGFAVCPKENLVSRYQVNRHMQVRHRMEWATIEEERRIKEREEDRSFQRELSEKAFGAIAENNSPKSEPGSRECEECGEVFTASSVIGAVSKLQSHNRKEHGSKG